MPPGPVAAAAVHKPHAAAVARGSWVVGGRGGAGRWGAEAEARADKEPNRTQDRAARQEERRAPRRARARARPTRANNKKRQDLNPTPMLRRYGRAMIGATNPLASAPGTLRGDLAIDTGRNVIHGSDGLEVGLGLGVSRWV
jgi:hypothetical protein